MVKNSKPAAEDAYGVGERTSRTDDLRIENVTPLPPPEHLIRFFPIAGTPVETLIATTDIVGAEIHHPAIPLAVHRELAEVRTGPKIAVAFVAGAIPARRGRGG